MPGWSPMRPVMGKSWRWGMRAWSIWWGTWPMRREGRESLCPMRPVEIMWRLFWAVAGTWMGWWRDWSEGRWERSRL